MVDLNKEIKLSDLFKRPEEAAPGRARSSLPSKPKQPKKQELVGLKVGASQIAASRVVNDGGSSSSSWRAHPSRRGSSWPARYAMSRRSARRSTASSPSTSCHGAGSVSESGRTASVSAPSTSTASTTNGSSATRFASAPTRRSRSRSTRRCSTTTSIGETIDESGALSRRVVLAAAYRSRSTTTSRPAGSRSCSCSGSISRHSPCCGRSRPASSTNGAGPAALVALSLGHDRSTLAISDGEICDFTRVLEWGGGEARDRDRPRTRPDREEAPETQARGLAARRRHRRATDPRVVRARAAVQREVQILARELVASLQFYQTQPGSLADRRDPRHGRDEPAARARRGARAADAGPRPARRSSGRCSGRARRR